MKLSAYQQQSAVVQQWQVPPFVGGIRADQYLVHRIGRLSRSRAQKVIDAGDFRTIDGPLKPSRRLFGGETVELWRIPPDEKSDVLPEIKVIFENDAFIVIDKPSDLVIHPTARYLYRTLTHWFSERYPENRPHPCHRLDRETSGVLVAARSHSAQSQIKSAFNRGEVKKIYLAIVRGEMKDPILINWPLALAGDRGCVKIRMIRDDEHGAPSETQVRPLQYSPEQDRTLVECHPKTGRQHQIRAHLAGEGFPIVGDKLYAMGDEYFDAFTKGLTISKPDHHRQALHAHAISFTLDGQEQSFSSPLPQDMVNLMSRSYLSMHAT